MIRRVGPQLAFYELNEFESSRKLPDSAVVSVCQLFRREACTFVGGGLIVEMPTPSPPLNLPK